MSDWRGNSPEILAQRAALLAGIPPEPPHPDDVVDAMEERMCDAVRRPDPEPGDLRYELRDRLAADERVAPERGWL